MAELAERPLALEHAGTDAAYVSAEGGRWVAARDLKTSDRLLLIDGRSATVTGLMIRLERTKVYNLKVARLHNYAVGNCGVLVHNTSPDGDRVYHGTDSDSARSIQEGGLDRRRQSDTAGGAGADDKGFSVTTDRKKAEMWAEENARRRGGDPVVLEADRSSLPLNDGTGVNDGWVDPDELYVPLDKFDDVGPGVFHEAS